MQSCSIKGDNKSEGPTTGHEKTNNGILESGFSPCNPEEHFDLMRTLHRIIKTFMLLAELRGWSRKEDFTS